MKNDTQESRVKNNKKHDPKRPKEKLLVKGSQFTKQKLEAILIVVSHFTHLYCESQLILDLGVNYVRN